MNNYKNPRVIQPLHLFCLEGSTNTIVAVSKRLAHQCITVSDPDHTQGPIPTVGHFLIRRLARFPGPQKNVHCSRYV